MSPRLAVVVVFLVALVLRVALLHTARFGGDEALFFRIGMDIVEGQGFPLLGTQITDGAGRLPGPAFLYVMALPLVVWRAPEAQFLFVEVLGALTVVVLWHALRRPFGERAAFITALLIACSPWSALYADRTWNPNVLPFFVALAFLAALRVREDPRSRWSVAVLPLLALMPQFHMSAPVAWAGLLVLVGKSALQVPRQKLLLGLGLAAILYIPLLVNETQTGLENTRHILAETVGKQGGERHPLGFVFVPVYALRFLTLDVSYHELSGYWGGPDELRCLKALWLGSPARPFHVLRFAALLVSVLLALAALGTVLRNALQQRRVGTFGLAFVAALVVNTALMGLAAKQVFGHYVTNLFPFVIVVWAALFQHLEHMKRARVVAVVAALVFMLGGIEATLAVSRRVDAKIGLEVHRRATAVIVDDAVAAGLAPSVPVHLEFRGLRSSLYDWHIFATRAAGAPLHFTTSARLRRYALTPLDAPPPPNAAGDAVHVGHALLWRLR
ncbi:MAG: glycosyltransferase family 39 protein [Deltaproteobacteria bacterium]|nr:glycosyltransferase family 39 protein [Deltaproteobacteria bacterium]